LETHGLWINAVFTIFRHLTVVDRLNCSFCFCFCFWQWYRGLNSGLHTCSVCSTFPLNAFKANLSLSKKCFLVIVQNNQS
jgi:hypothetical protein